MPEQGWCLPGKQTMKSLSLYGSQGRCRKGGARNKMLETTIIQQYWAEFIIFYIFDKERLNF